MNAERIVKKYPNRRLYDTAVSKYVALDDIRRLVVDGVPLKVVDAKTETDITRSILLQIIVEQEDRGQPILTTELMEKIIRFYGDTLQALMSTYLERSVDSFVKQQEALHKHVANLMEQTPVSVLTEVTEVTERNIELWKNMQDALYKGFDTEQPTKRTKPTEDGDA